MHSSTRGFPGCPGAAHVILQDFACRLFKQGCIQIKDTNWLVLLPTKSITTSQFRLIWIVINNSLHNNNNILWIFLFYMETRHFFFWNYFIAVQVFSRGRGGWVHLRQAVCLALCLARCSLEEAILVLSYSPPLPPVESISRGGGRRPDLFWAAVPAVATQPVTFTPPPLGIQI